VFDFFFLFFFFFFFLQVTPIFIIESLFDELPVFPPSFGSFVSFNIGALSMLRSILPVSLVSPTVLHIHDPEPIPLVILELPFVPAAVRPVEHALPVHLVIRPLALINLTIRPPVCAFATQLAIKETPSILTPIRISQRPLP